MTDQQKTDPTSLQKMQRMDLDILLANLRKVESGQDDGFDPAAACTMWHRNPEGPQAADLIEALRAERDEAVAIMREWGNAKNPINLAKAQAMIDTFLQSIARETGK